MYFYVPAADVSILPREMSRSDRGVRGREALSVFQNSSRRNKKRDRGTLLDLLITCKRPKRRQTFPFSPGRCHAVTEGYETARPGAFFQNSSRRRKKKDRGTTPRSLKNVRATETAADVSVLPREMSRSDRGVRGREALSVFQNSSRRNKKRDRGTLLDLLIMCERRDSNPYARRHQILSLAWLPITTRSQIPSGRLIT